MPSPRQRRKSRFLEAFVRIGTISGAARRARLSRESVHDWLKSDETFARQFAHAKRRHENEPFRSLDASLVFFTHVVKPLFDNQTWPKVASALAIAVANLKNDLKGGWHHAAVRSGDGAEISLSQDGFAEMAVPNRVRENSAHDL